MTRSELPVSLQWHLDAITASIGSMRMADWQERIVRQIYGARPMLPLSFVAKRK